jgi:GTPase SAR1 family protein
MSDRRKSRLDALERRLVGPKRIALFGHRAVGKTTLLAMFYREASAGRVPGVRLAAVDPHTAEYLAEKITRIESGESPAGTLAETELNLRLYSDTARLDLIVRDYQGEHVTLGSEEPILAFFSECDAVLLCLDPEGVARGAERHRRQQEVEQLLERYIERSDDATADRPVALLITKYDRVLARGGPTPDRVDDLVEIEYGMTRYALGRHAPRSAVFAVSSYGPEALGDGRPPAHLHPMGLEGPLGWLADQLEAVDRDRLDWLWDLAPDDLPRLTRCLTAFEQRYPRCDALNDYHRRLRTLRRRRLRRRLVTFGATAAALVLAALGYDAWGYRRALAFERDQAAPAVARRWADLLAWHPTLPWTFPASHRQAARKLAEWTVKAAEVQVANATATPDLNQRLKTLKDENPALVLQIQKVEQAQDRQRHDQRWKELQAASLVATDRAEDQLDALRGFVEEFDWTPHREEIARLADSLRRQVAERTLRRHTEAVEAIRRAAGRPGADLRDLIDQADRFLAENADTPLRDDVVALRDDLIRALDEQDFDKARSFDQNPAHATFFQARIDRYQRYLDAHKSGGRFLSQALEAKDRILRQWDDYSYRLAYDHHVAHPGDAPKVAELLRAYLHAHQDGRHAREAEAFLAWWEQVSQPSKYTVTLLKGAVDPNVGKYLAGGGPDLAVTIWVSGVKHGPTPAIPNSHTPIWKYTFPAPITWKYGDAVTVQITDTDWSDSVVFTFHSPKGDPLAMRMLSGTIKPTIKGDKPTLTFASTFEMPRLPAPTPEATASRRSPPR